MVREALASPQTFATGSSQAPRSASKQQPGAAAAMTKRCRQINTNTRLTLSPGFPWREGREGGRGRHSLPILLETKSCNNNALKISQAPTWPENVLAGGDGGEKKVQFPSKDASSAGAASRGGLSPRM